MSSHYITSIVGRDRYERVTGSRLGKPVAPKAQRAIAGCDGLGDRSAQRATEIMVPRRSNKAIFIGPGLNAALVSDGSTCVTVLLLGHYFI